MMQNREAAAGDRIVHVERPGAQGCTSCEQERREIDGVISAERTARFSLVCQLIGDRISLPAFSRRSRRFQ